jgi:hypothetical protein
MCGYEGHTHDEVSVTIEYRVDSDGVPATVPPSRAVMTRDSDFKKLVRQRMAAAGQSYTAARAAIYRPAADVDLPLTRRVFGLKTSYTVAFDGGQSPAVPVSTYSASWCPGPFGECLPGERWLSEQRSR